MFRKVIVFLWKSVVLIKIYYVYMVYLRKKSYFFPLLKNNFESGTFIDLAFNLKFEVME